MYSPCLVLPYQRSDGQWYTFEAVFTHTLSGPPPGATVAEGPCVWVDGGCVDAGEPGAGVAAPPAAELLAFPVELLEPLPAVLEPFELEAPVPVPWLAALVAALSIPPCRLHAPRPPWGEVVPSLQVTGVLASAALLIPGIASNAAQINTPQAWETQSRILMSCTFLMIISGFKNSPAQKALREPL
jgi:hypothetical protein